ncbi:Uncharacterized protein K02A2.6 [Stylophora pistillata]|uniref:Uncharacterized protein K02A2.6 n=1 Tax=Stylophora pistillata TaxID=50429 RepID=A0A2B4RGY5_STYPI|nr:Uncharacterized protein K02A2.6 [Stylophora pistillata]
MQTKRAHQSTMSAEEVCEIPNPRPKLEDVVQQYPKLFDGKLGTITGFTAQLKVKENATRRYLKSRPMTYALREKVEKELKRLVKEGVLKKVESSDWATPIVPVLKPDGTVRICGDFKLTINPYLDVPEYPMPTPDELFTKLNGGELSTKLELSHAYQQVVLDEKTQPYVTINTHLGLYRYTRLPFGVAAAPGIFLQMIDKMLDGLTQTGAILDDLIVTVLVHHNTKLQVQLAVDASPVGLGAVTSHITANGTERPIAYASRSLTKSERNYSVIEKEALAIIFGIRKFQQFLYGRRLTLLTDHQSLSLLFGSKKAIPAVAASRIQRWAMQLSVYQYDIKYRRSKQNENADALSRLPCKGTDVGLHIDEESADVNRVQVARVPINSKRLREDAARAGPSVIASHSLHPLWMVGQVRDAKSKWLEVIPMSSTTAQATVDALRSLFAIHGLPEEIVSDNGPQFIAQEFKDFLRYNHVKQILSAPYHPASNGEAERAYKNKRQPYIRNLQSYSNASKRKLESPAFPRSDSVASAGNFVLVAAYFGHQLTFRSRWARLGRKQQLWLVAIRVPVVLELYGFAGTQVD